MSLEDYYNELETRLGSILHTLGSQLSPEESREVSHFLDVGEYGLALQTLTDLLIEERKKISGILYFTQGKPKLQPCAKSILYNPGGSKEIRGQVVWHAF